MQQSGDKITRLILLEKASRNNKLLYDRTERPFVDLKTINPIIELSSLSGGIEMFTRRHYLLWIIGIILPFMLSNCSRFNSAKQQYIRITNKTNRTLAFTAWETDAANRVNISQRFSIAKSTNPLIKPGQSVLISIKNINGHFGPGKTMKLFLYAVHDSMAYANNNLTISYKDLHESDFQYSIRRKDLYYLNDALYFNK